MTLKPRSASRRQKSSSQPTIWAPRPLISTKGAPDGSPKVSYSISIPFALARGIETILSSLPDLGEFEGHLGDSPESLADWFDANERAHRLLAKVVVYTTMSYSVDVGNQEAAARSDRARSVAAQLGAAAAFAVPEMLEIGLPRLREWVAKSPRLANLGHYFDRLEKLQKRIRSAEVEELLTQVSDPL